MQAVTTTIHRASVVDIPARVVRLGDRRQGRVVEQYRSTVRASTRLVVDQEVH